MRTSADMARYAIARLEEIDELDNGHIRFRPIRHHFGITTFGATASTAQAEGDLLIKEHDESEPTSSEELYVVLSGRARFDLDGSAEDVAAGAFIHVPAGMNRAARALEPATTVLALGAGPPDRPYEATGWEPLEPIFLLYEHGHFGEAADLALPLLAAPGATGFLYYNVACFESRAGRREDAIDHLRRAIELSPALVAYARDDEDLASLHDDPQFVAIIED